MNHAEKCPVCNGRGKLPLDLEKGVHGTGELSSYSQICHGCGGKGWVVVPDDCVIKKEVEK